MATSWFASSPPASYTLRTARPRSTLPEKTNMANVDFRRNQEDESDHQANSRQSEPDRAAQQKADDGTAKQHS